MEAWESYKARREKNAKNKAQNDAGRKSDIYDYKRGSGAYL